MAVNLKRRYEAFPPVNARIEHRRGRKMDIIVAREGPVRGSLKLAPCPLPVSTRNYGQRVHFDGASYSDHSSRMLFNSRHEPTHFPSARCSLPFDSVPIPSVISTGLDVAQRRFVWWKPGAPIPSKGPSVLYLFCAHRFRSLRTQAIWIPLEASAARYSVAFVYLFKRFNS